MYLDAKDKKRLENRTFTYYTDPGHGWLRVEWDDLEALGMQPTDFSRYSYRDDKAMFLEEDVDAGRFVRVYEAAFGKRPKVVHRHANNLSSIRRKRWNVLGFAGIWK